MSLRSAMLFDGSSYFLNDFRRNGSRAFKLGHERLELLKFS
jgi:predicted nucleic acid-binding Zn ribbon protein